VKKIVDIRNSGPVPEKTNIEQSGLTLVQIRLLFLPREGTAMRMPSLCPSITLVDCDHIH